MALHKVEISGVNTANIKVLTSEEILEIGKKMLKRAIDFALLVVI